MPPPSHPYCSSKPAATYGLNENAFLGRVVMRRTSCDGDMKSLEGVSKGARDFLKNIHDHVGLIMIVTAAASSATDTKVWVLFQVGDRVAVDTLEGTMRHPFYNLFFCHDFTLWTGDTSLCINNMHLNTPNQRHSSGCTSHTAAIKLLIPADMYTCLWEHLKQTSINVPLKNPGYSYSLYFVCEILL